MAQILAEQVALVTGGSDDIGGTIARHLGAAGAHVVVSYVGGVAAGGHQQAVLGRVGQADDIAQQVLTFVTSRSISGQIMVVDGGMPGAMR